MTDIAAVHHVMILAGGENSRMEALRGTIYKAFLPIHGLSLISRHLIRLSAYGVRTVSVVVDEIDPVLQVLSSGSSGSLAQGAGNMPTVDILAHRGTAAEKIRWSAGRSPMAEKHLIVVGDTLAPVDIHQLWRQAHESRFDSVLGVAEVRLPFGVLSIHENAITEFHDNPATGMLVNTGYMVLGAEALDLMHRGSDLNETLRGLAAANRLGAVRCPGPVIAVDSLGSLAVAHDALQAT